MKKKYLREEDIKIFMAEGAPQVKDSGEDQDLELGEVEDLYVDFILYPL